MKQSKAIDLYLAKNESASQTVEIIQDLLNGISPTLIAKQHSVQRAWVYKVNTTYINNKI